MKRPDYFSSYYVSIGRTGFNLKICPALAKVTSSVSQMKLGESAMLKQAENFQAWHSKLGISILKFQVLKPELVWSCGIRAGSTKFRAQREKLPVQLPKQITHASVSSPEKARWWC